MKLITELGKFKVGDYWRTRDGRKALIIGFYYSSIYENYKILINYLNKNNMACPLFLFENGNYFIENATSEYDLIEPWIDEPECKFKVGEFWESRNGSIWEIVGIEELEGNGSRVLAIMNFRISYPAYFEIDGRYRGFYNHDNDLIKPWVEPKLELEEGKLYKLVNGKQAYCFYTTDEDCWLSIKGTLFHLRYNLNGKCFYRDKQEFNVECEWKDKQGT